MEALHIQPWEADRATTEEEEEEEQEKCGERDGGGTEAPSTSDEETDEDSEPEAPAVIRRKVSFADAFGLNLVSVKEFDTAEVTEPDVSLPPKREAPRPTEEFYMSCLFTVPSSPDELDHRLEAQMVELESIELLPGSSTIRGIIRVVNLCYSKSVYVRMSLDRWTSHFDLLAEYVPGSSDRKTDRFNFTYTLVPPFQKEGVRVELCLCYNTSAGTFWANNKGVNYVLFCHQKGHVNEQGLQAQEESSSSKSKRSCLKANRRGSAEEKTREACNTSAAVAEAEATDKAEEAVRKTVDRGEIQSLLYQKERNPTVDSIKSRRRATRLARVQDYLSQRRQQGAQAYPPDSAGSQGIPPPPLPTVSGDAAGFLQKRQTKQSKDGPQVLTYHEIPLLTLDWNNEKNQQCGAAHMDDMWTVRTKVAPKVPADDAEAAPSVTDMWESILNGTDDAADKQSPVCNVWQAFLNGPSCTDHSAVPESEWLQTATSVSPSNDKEPKTHAHTSADSSQQPPSESAAANVAPNAVKHQPAAACVSSPGDSDTEAQDASQRSETNSERDTRQEFSLKGAAPASEGSVDSSAACHRRATRERERVGIIGGAEGTGSEPVTPRTADLVTSSEESETTGTAGTPQCQNASAADRISQGAGQDGGLCSSREGQVTSSTHNAAGDTLAFRGTIRQGTKDGEGFVFPTSRHGAEEGGVNNCTANKVSTREEIFRPQKTEEKCEISQRGADEKQREEFRLESDGGKPLQANGSDADETRQSHNQTRDGNFKRSPAVKSDGEAGEIKNTEGEEALIGAEAGVIQVSNEEARQRDEDVSQPISCWQRGNTGAHDKQPRPEQRGGERRAQEEEMESETGVSNKTEEGKGSSRNGITSQEIIHYDQDSFRPFPTDKCSPNPVEVTAATRWIHPEEDMKGQGEDVGRQTSPEEVTAKEEAAEKDASTALHLQPDALERTEEAMSQKDKDERVSIAELEIEAPREPAVNAGIPQGERKSVQLSAEVESPPRVEHETVSPGTKDSITVGATVALQAMGSGSEEQLIERFAEDLVRGVWEEVFNPEVQAWNTVDRTAIDHPIEQDLGVLSSIDAPSDPNSCFCQGPEQTSEVRSNRCPPEAGSQSVSTKEQIPSESQIDPSCSVHLSPDLSSVLAAQTRQMAPGQSPPNAQGNSPQIKERSVGRQETGAQIEDSVVAHKEGSNRSPQKHPSASSEKLKQSSSFAWWSMFYFLSHITRLLLCVVLVAGFFFVVFLYDFSAFFALYVFSFSCWFYKWKRHGVTATEG